ncbi:MAG TPA: RNA 2',3'-cyclic phosphodiesterase [Gaiellaceae bacterium]|nr:RNA 2',3'-cyclic phosphodiesterase [Gaiellaceae bacterium]
MTATASVGGRERLRLFCALRLPDDVVDELARWQAEAFGRVEGVRVVGREQLHVTLAFLGSRPAGELEAIAIELRAAARAAAPATLTVKGYRETRSVGMLVLEDEGGRATSLAVDLHERLERLGVYERERRHWLPHLTVIRFRHATRPRMTITTLPELGSFSPSDAAVYMSTLRPSGAQYSVLESVGVGR